jgi:hypothetical protein
LNHTGSPVTGWSTIAGATRSVRMRSAPSNVTA